MAQKPSDPPYDKFKSLLFSGTLKAGQFVTQKELINHLEMSLGPVRTALARLESDGFIQILPQRGIQIAEPSLALFRNIIQIRIALEKEAWTKFALNANDEILEEFERVHLEFIEIAENDKITSDVLRAATDYDRKMHDRVVSAMNNDLFLRLFQTNIERMILIRPDRGNIKASTLLGTMNEHLAMIQGCIERDPSAVVKAIEAHLMSSVHRFVDM